MSTFRSELDGKDHETFIDTLEEACTKIGWLVHAFVLMGNHYHLLVETPEANLVAGRKRGSWGHDLGIHKSKDRPLFPDPFFYIMHGQIMLQVGEIVKVAAFVLR